MDLYHNLLLSAHAKLTAYPEYYAAIVYQHPDTTVNYHAGTTLLGPSNLVHPPLTLNPATKLSFTAAFAALGLNINFKLIFNEVYGLVIIKRLN